MAGWPHRAGPIRFFSAFGRNPIHGPAHRVRNWFLYMCVIYCWEILNWRLGACEPLFTRESLWIKYSLLNFWNFAKKNIKICKKNQILDLEKKNQKNLKTSKISKTFLKFFHWKSYWKSKNRKFQNFEIFDFQYDFQWKIFKNIFEIFEISKCLRFF